jgi:hypothetical protein
MEATEIKFNVPLLVSVIALEEEIPTTSVATFVFASAARTPCLTGEVPRHHLPSCRTRWHRAGLGTSPGTL